MKLIGLSARNLIVTSQKSKSKAITDKEKEKFHSYFKFRRNLEELKCFQLLALLRGERIKALSVSWDLDGYDWKRLKNYKIRKSLWCFGKQEKYIGYNSYVELVFISYAITISKKNRNICPSCC